MVDDYRDRMILWVNGPFGVGKTTTANAIRQQEPIWRLFDPEGVGYKLRASLGDLDADVSALRARIAADQADRRAKQWRLDQIPAYELARSWLTASADPVVDTTGLASSDAASRILGALN